MLLATRITARQEFDRCQRKVSNLLQEKRRLTAYFNYAVKLFEGWNNFIKQI
jgi:hypothetical protein